MNKHTVILIRIIVVIELLLGIILFSKEIINYINFTIIKEVDSQFNDIVDWFLYKDSCYKNLFLYLLIIVTGISFWISKKLYWALTQILLITLSFIIMLNLFASNSLHLKTNICLGSLLTFIFLYLEIKICNPLLLNKIGVAKRVKYLCVCLGGLFCFIWVILS